MKEDRAGGDDAIRPAFAPAPTGLAPYGWSIYRFHQNLVALRRRHPWLHRARTRKDYLTNEQLVLTMAEGPQGLFLALNLADVPALLPVPGALLIEAGDGDLVAGSDSGMRVSLGPHGWAILSPKTP